MTQTLCDGCNEEYPLTKCRGCLLYFCDECYAEHYESSLRTCDESSLRTCEVCDSRFHECAGLFAMDEVTCPDGVWLCPRCKDQ